MMNLYFCKCGENSITEGPAQPIYCYDCNTVLHVELNPSLQQLNMLDKGQLAMLWRMFEQVLYNPTTEEITERFLVWLPTTNRFAIWL